MVRRSGQPATAASTTSMGRRNTQAERTRCRVSCERTALRTLGRKSVDATVATFPPGQRQCTSQRRRLRPPAFMARLPAGPAEALQPALELGEIFLGRALAGQRVVHGGPELLGDL